LLSTGDPFIFLVILAAFILLSLPFIHVFPLRPPTLLFKRAKKNQVGWRDYTVVWEAYCSIASIVDLLKWQNEYIASSVTSCIKHICIGPMSKTYTSSVTSTSSVTGITLNIKPAVPVCIPNYITYFNQIINHHVFRYLRRRDHDTNPQRKTSKTKKGKEMQRYRGAFHRILNRSQPDLNHLDSSFAKPCPQKTIRGLWLEKALQKETGERSSKRKT
jgi:hypothetical protein